MNNIHHSVFLTIGSLKTKNILNLKSDLRFASLKIKPDIASIAAKNINKIAPPENCINFFHAFFQ